MSEIGLASRREADEWIASGWVRVDGRVVAELGSRVLPSQQITIDARARNAQAQLVTVLLNKPVGYVSGQAEDGYQPAMVLITPDEPLARGPSRIRFLPATCAASPPPAGWTSTPPASSCSPRTAASRKRLIGDDSEVEKEYLVRVASGTLPERRHGAAAPRPRARRREAEARARVDWANDDQLRFVLARGPASGRSGACASWSGCR